MNYNKRRSERPLRALMAALCTLWLFKAHGAETVQWAVFETSFETTKQYAKPFTDVEIDEALS